MKVSNEHKIKKIIQNIFLILRKDAKCSRCEKDIFNIIHDFQAKLNLKDFDLKFRCKNCEHDYILGIKYKAIDNIIDRIDTINYYTNKGFII